MTAAATARWDEYFKNSVIFNAAFSLTLKTLCIFILLVYLSSTIIHMHYAMHNHTIYKYYGPDHLNAINITLKSKKSKCLPDSEFNQWLGHCILVSMKIHALLFLEPFTSTENLKTLFDMLNTTYSLYRKPKCWL